MGAAGESAAAIATLLKHSPHAVRKRAHLLKIKWPVRSQGQRGNHDEVAGHSRRSLFFDDSAPAAEAPSLNERANEAIPPGQKQ
jgi:hypothetical protein